jgi:prophage regulatory protein
MQPRNARLLRLAEVKALTGFGNTTVYRRIADGLLTVGVPIGPMLRGWPAREIEAINEARIRGDSDDEIRELVVRLETSRTGKPATPRRKQPAAAAGSSQQAASA